MNDCIDHNVREQLPDLLHQTLGAVDRERVERHVASCESCSEELAVLRTVKGAAIFAPTIDVAQIVRRIPPYQRIAPPAEAPVPSRVPRWLVAAAAAALVVTGGSLVLTRQTAPVRTVAGSVSSVVVAGASTRAVRTPEVPVAKPVIAEPAAPSHAYALASDVGGLSDGNLVQLMNDMDDFDALPTSEPEPMLPVDSGDSL